LKKLIQMGRQYICPGILHMKNDTSVSSLHTLQEVHKGEDWPA
jgi:hypothetical protein